DGCVPGVGAGARGLGPDLGCNTDDVGVVAGAARHRVAARTSVDHVVAGVARQHIVERIAGGVDCAGSGERHVLDIRACSKGDRALDQVRPLTGVFGDDVANVVHDVRVVAESTDQRIGPAAAI